jgi:diadenosine tetraphosphatase ApaH/serine/threonine PP2A family protein phosphatase
MKLALITDIHGNREALEAVLAHAEAAGCDRYAFLGDYVGYGTDSAWVVEQVQAHVARGAIAVRGNHDEGVSQGPSPTMTPLARQVVEWTRKRLPSAQLGFLQQLPLVHEEDELLFTHANGFAPAGWEYITDCDQATRSLNATEQARFTFCGHVHEPCLYQQGALRARCTDSLPFPDHALKLSGSQRWLVLPGSTGQPRDGNPAACYASFVAPQGDMQAVLRFHRVPYDHPRTAAKIMAAGLPQVLALRLLTGT